MNKKWATLGLSIGVLGGGAAGFIVTSGSPGAGADAVATRTMPRAQSTEDTTVTTTVGSDDSSDSNDRPSKADRLAEILAPLVEDGTITQDQADAVIAAIEEAAPVGRGLPGGRGHGPFGPGIFGDGLDSLTSALDMSLDELFDALRDGTSIAELAQQAGVDVQQLIDDAVAGLKAHLDEEVAAGEHTQAEADQILERATQAITDFLNGEFSIPFGGMGPMGAGHVPFGRSHHGPFGDDDADDTGSTDSTTTTVG